MYLMYPYQQHDNIRGTDNRSDRQHLVPCDDNLEVEAGRADLAAWVEDGKEEWGGEVAEEEEEEEEDLAALYRSTVRRPMINFE
mmetsp:Transcript_21102/g.43334  ORF Transcript_21102/g.43334 Transcript_21102/m.43334 type:complete len:84 (+) Transcript_21102:128-379(+)